MLRRGFASPRLDAAVAVALSAATVVEEWGQHYRHAGIGPRAGLAVLAILIGVPLAWRRRAPLAVLAVVVAGVVGSGVLATAEFGSQAMGQGPLAPFLAVLLAVFSFGAYTEGRQILVGGAVLATAAGATVLAAGRGTGADWGFWVAAAICTM